MLKLHLDDTFTSNLPADSNLNNNRRQVLNAAYSYVTPRVPSDPKLVHVSTEMLQEIGLKAGDQYTEEFLKIFSGAQVIEGTKPYAMCYGGHQFGHWAGQLGDGRAINIAEVVHNHKRWVLQLKGAGETPYSRSADGLAVLRSSVREHLCSEAMYHLGVPTTRSLSLMLTGDEVMRDMLYDGNAAYEKGAVVCRVAPSFLRFGNYQIFAARRDVDNLKKLVDYTIKVYFPEIKKFAKEGYIQFFKQVVNRTLDMIIHWQRVGFVHGVMNTDNMSILGLTIDYGPYGWLEGYDPNWTPNTTDAEGKRYRFGHQPRIALWNLVQLANALFPLIEDAQPLQEILGNFQNAYSLKYTAMMRAKLGLHKALNTDEDLIIRLESVLQATETDMTIFFRNLSKVNRNHTGEEFLEIIKDSFYFPDLVTGLIKNQWLSWYETYIERLGEEGLSDQERQIKMNLANPKYVLRNYMAQLAIDEADKGNYELIEELYQLLKKPYDEQPDQVKWFAKRPEWARNKVGCSMLSCSS